MVGPAVAGAVASNVATLLQLMILVGTADPKLLLRLALPLAGAGVTALAYALLQTWRARGAEAAADRGHAFRLTSALFFAGLVTLLSLATILVQRLGGVASVLVTSALAGFVDAHAPAAAVSSVYASGQISLQGAEYAVLLALTTNALTKCGLALASRCAPYARRVIIGVVLSIGAAWVVFLVRGP